MSAASKLVILGAGESGVGAALLGMQQGFDVFVSDQGKVKAVFKKKLQDMGVPFEEGTHTEEQIMTARIVVKSPGIPEDAPLVQKLKAKGIPVISEIEYAARFSKGKMICITGSNGKTTTTLLTYHILQKAGLDVGLAGNVGKSLAAQVATKDREYYVVELSSFQLDGMFDFRADVAILLNITPDHLDRYNYEMQNYTNSKFRITRNQRPEDVFIYCQDDEIVHAEISQRTFAQRLLPFSIKEKVDQGGFLQNDQLTIHYNANQFSMSIFELALQGKHNIYNSMAAAIAAQTLNIRKEVIRESLEDFQNIEHRLEFVGTVHGIDFINDSKATNVNSTWYALESMNKPVVLILGGKDKGNNYGMLTDLVKEKVKAIVCLGIDNKKIHRAFKDIVPTIIDTMSADDAVRMSYKLGKKGDTVLLSPACASFDLFENYEERGRKFKAAVKAL